MNCIPIAIGTSCSAVGITFGENASLSYKSRPAGETYYSAENQTLINHKCVCGVPNRHFCQTRVSGSFTL